MIVLSRDFGVTWDELSRQRFGELIVEYYRGTIGIDRFQSDGSRLYGGLFDVTAVGLQHLLPFDLYAVRHGLNAVFGWLGIVACAALGTSIGGPWVGILSAMLATTAPRYFAHSMNNPKDIPFAAFAAWSLFAISRMRFSYPYLPPRVVAGAGVAIGLSLSVRPGGLLFLAYAGGLLLIVLLLNRERNLQRLATTAAAFTLLTLIATTIPLPFWPWLQTHPYLGLIDAVRGVSDVGWDGVMLFNGHLVRASAAPWTYVPVWLLYTMPPVVLGGALLSLGHLQRAGPVTYALLCLWFAVIFPIAYVIVRQSTIYDGIRQLLFVVPPLFVIASLGWWWCLSTVGGRARAVAAVLLALGMVEPVLFQVRNHPNQVVYFNAFLGGPRSAFGRFDLDYWGNCYFAAMQRAAPLARRAHVPVAISGRQWRQMLLNAPRVREVVVTDPTRDVHHLELVLLRGQRHDMKQAIERSDVIYDVTTADGTQLCLAVPGPRYRELQLRLAVSEE
jgi:hypothetical protein